MSANGRFLIFSAQAKPKTNISYFENTAKKTNDTNTDTNTNSDEDKTFGQKFISKQHWGEQMTKTQSPAVFLLDFETETLKISKQENFSFGDPQISANNKILYTAYRESPYKETF